MIICPSCHTKNERHFKICIHCGKELEQFLTYSKETPKPISPPPLSKDYVPMNPIASGALPMSLIVEQFGIEIAVEVNENGISIGREDAEGNVFPDIDTSTFGGNLEGVSRMHAQITLQSNQYFIQDLNSTNGTYVNRIKVGQAQKFPLNNNDELVLGRLKFRVKLHESD
ncbi:FHA domain-containing protein [candidate division KSB1 bacterium]|nr:FHA domain-containing protein [candidate division KSB1 bacterium]